jgi:hypothetical protein
MLSLIVLAFVRYKMTSPDFDPLKICCITVLGTDDPYEVTPFQGFSISLRFLSWAFELIASLPADVLERAQPLEDVIAQRMGGARSIAWGPFNIKALEGVEAAALGAFAILFSGEKDCAERIAKWAKNQKHPVLHISSQEAEGACLVNDFSIEALRTYCLEVLKKSPDLFSEEQRQAAEASLLNWSQPNEKPSGLKFRGHNITKPNYIALRRAFRIIEPGEPYVGRSEQEYTDVILESAKAVAQVRKEPRATLSKKLSSLQPRKGSSPAVRLNLTFLLSA